MNVQHVLDLVKLRMQLDSTHDSLVTSYIDEIINRIKSYCHITDIPEELEQTASSMVIDLLRLKVPHIGSIGASMISEVRLGDVSVKPTVAQVSAEDIVSSYQHDLRMYRKMRW